VRSHLVIAFVAAGALASCGDDPDGPPSTSTRDEGPRAEAPARPFSPPPCPPDLASCRRASGTIIYVERVDPDGDGDAHFVLLSPESVTAPGITIVDVRRDLRPRPLPGPGERLAAAGPVSRGSRDQRQIEAVAVKTAP
jgi:hypothetical protein